MFEYVLKCYNNLKLLILESEFMHNFFSVDDEDSSQQNYGKRGRGGFRGRGGRRGRGRW